MASKLKKIFIDHWERFVELYEHKIRKSVIKAVEKMINYGSLEKGYIEYECPKCGKFKK